MRNSVLYTSVLFMAIASSLLVRTMGHPWWCSLRDLSPWISDAWSSHTSQHLLDPYSFTHVLHGVIFYALFAFIPLQWRLFLAALLECSWEILENSPFIINRYRTATASLGYLGDSVINSLGDVLCCLFGFYLASRLKPLHTLLVAIAIESILLFTVRDNLTLNVIMLLYPISAVREWQQALVGLVF